MNDATLGSSSTIRMRMLLKVYRMKGDEAKSVSWIGLLLRGFEAKTIPFAGEGDEFSRLVVIVGGLPRGLPLRIDCLGGAADDFVDRVFFFQGQGMPFRANVYPQKIRQA